MKDTPALRRASRARHSPRVRAAAVAAAREGLSAGRSLTSLAAEMALPVTTLQRWLTAGRPAFRPVRVTEGARPGGSVTLRTAQGHVVEGLDVPMLVAVLRALEGVA